MKLKHLLLHTFMTLMAKAVKNDDLYLRILYFLKMHRKLNLNKPKTFSEKLQWLKINDTHPEYTKMVDKVTAKEWVREKIGPDYIIPTLAIYDSVDDVDFKNLSSQFVLKVTHDSGGIVVCKNRANINIKKAKKTLRKALMQSFYSITREYPYKDVPRRVIAEKYIEDESGELRDYKFFCFDGKVKFFKIDFDRYTNHHANYYDPTGRLLPFGEARYLPIPSRNLVIPKNFQEMIALAEKLSQGIPFLRVDLYNTHGKIYFGELTFFPASGMGKFYPEEWDLKIGEWLNLPNK